MSCYDYESSMISDIVSYFHSNYDSLEDYAARHGLPKDPSAHEVIASLYDELESLDSITGVYSYYFSREEDAAEAVASNIPLLFEAVEALNISPDEDVRIDDSFIRQYLLKSCIELALVDLS